MGKIFSANFFKFNFCKTSVRELCRSCCAAGQAAAPQKQHGLPRRGSMACPAGAAGPIGLPQGSVLEEGAMSTGLPRGNAWADHAALQGSTVRPCPTGAAGHTVQPRGSVLPRRSIFSPKKFPKKIFLKKFSLKNFQKKKFSQKIS